VEFPSKELLNYGVAVVVLVPFLTFFLWAGRMIVRSLLKHVADLFAVMNAQQTVVGDYIKEQTAVMAALREAVAHSRSDAVSAVRDVGVQLERVTWQAHEKMVTVFRDSLTGAAQSIRTSNERMAEDFENRRLREKVEELSRPHDVGDGRVRG
jgi:hypothetical protein